MSEDRLVRRMSCADGVWLWFVVMFLCYIAAWVGCAAWWSCVAMPEAGCQGRGLNGHGLNGRISAAAKEVGCLGCGWN